MAILATLSSFLSSSTETFHDVHQRDHAAAGLQVRRTSNGLLVLLFLGGSLLTVASVLQNVFFAVSIASGVIGVAIMSMLLVGFNFLEIAFPTLVRNAWNDGRYVFCAVISFGFVCAAMASFVAGTSYYADQVEQAETSRMHDSPDFARNQRTQEDLQAELKVLAVSPAAVLAAQREIDTLDAKRAVILRKNSGFMNEDYSPKGNWYIRTGKAVKHELTPLDDAISEQQRIIQQYHDYQAKSAALDHLQASSGDIAKDEKTIPGFRALADWFGMQAKVVQVNILTTANMFMTFLAAVAWYAFSLNTERKELSHADMLQAQYQQVAYKQIELQSQIHEAEVINDIEKRLLHLQAIKNNISPPKTAQKAVDKPPLNNPDHDDDKDDKKDESKAEEEQDGTSDPTLHIMIDDMRRERGKSYPCVICGETYVAKNVHHVKCSECRKRSKSGVRRTKEGVATACAATA